MAYILDEVIEKLENLNLININLNLSTKIAIMAINSTENYIKCEINSFIKFSQIKEIFIDIVIGEYLLLIKSANLDENMEFEPAIKAISEGDVSITYYLEKTKTKEERFDQLIEYFLGKKKLLLNYKSIRW